MEKPAFLHMPEEDLERNYNAVELLLKMCRDEHVEQEVVLPSGLEGDARVQMAKTMDLIANVVHRVHHIMEVATADWGPDGIMMTCDLLLDAGVDWHLHPFMGDLALYHAWREGLSVDIFLAAFYFVADEMIDISTNARISDQLVIIAAGAVVNDAK